MREQHDVRRRVDFLDQSVMQGHGQAETLAERPHDLLGQDRAGLVIGAHEDLRAQGNLLGRVRLRP